MHGHLWNNISKHIQGWIIQCCTSYHQNLRACTKGKEKFAQLQIEWMGMHDSIRLTRTTCFGQHCSYSSTCMRVARQRYRSWRLWDSTESRISISSVGSSENFQSPVFTVFSSTWKAYVPSSANTSRAGFTGPTSPSCSTTALADCTSIHL